MAYLERIRMDAFGRFSNRVIGPFSPGLNVVFGRNEAGKSTVSAFVEGVLFGWPEARGAKNTYKPKVGERSGTLFFRDPETGIALELSRARNAEGLKADPRSASDIMADVDKETFRTMFALTSDELRGLSATSVTDKLLTAGSGTGASPAEALERIEVLIRLKTTRSASCEESLPNLRARLEQCRLRQAALREEADALRAEDAEFASLEEELSQLKDEMARAHARAGRLARAHATAEGLAGMHASCLEELDRNAEELARADAELEAYRAANPDAIVLSEVEERSLRDRLSGLAQRVSDSRNRCNHAQELYADAYAAEQALLDGEWAVQTAHRLRKERTRNRVMAFVLPAMFLTAALASFWQGAATHSPAWVVAGGVFAAASIAFGGAGLYLSTRRDRSSADMDASRQAAHEKTQAAWAHLASCRSRLEMDAEELDGFLRSTVLAPAAGSAQAAFGMLDAAAGMRTARRSRDEAARRLERDRMACEQELESIEARYADTFAAIGIPLDDDARIPDVSELVRIDALIAAADAHRDGIQQTIDGKSRRYGELKQKLEAGLNAEDLDRVKLERAQLKTRLDAVQRDFACLLLARQMLADAMEMWEAESQPEVYAKASQLLSVMTGGAWVEVRMSEEGELTVKSAVHEVLEPKHLSLGTAQQLYLAMRMALLSTAQDVGKSIPVLADDILVNFDDERRRGAVAALAELSRTRQVIVFTCHEEIVQLFKQAAADHTLIEL